MGILRDRRMTWLRVLGGGVEVHVVPGDHEAMLREPEVCTLAVKLRESLEKAQAQAGVV